MTSCAASWITAEAIPSPRVRIRGCVKPWLRLPSRWGVPSSGLTAAGSASSSPRPPPRAHPYKKKKRRPLLQDSFLGTPRSRPPCRSIPSRPSRLRARAAGRQLRHWVNTTITDADLRPAGRGGDGPRTLDNPNPALQGHFDAVPLPAGAKPSAAPTARDRLAPRRIRLGALAARAGSATAWHQSWGGKLSAVAKTPRRLPLPPSASRRAASRCSAASGAPTTLTPPGRSPRPAISVPEATAGVFRLSRRKKKNPAPHRRHGHRRGPEGTRYPSRPSFASVATPGCRNTLSPVPTGR